ncbi:MAG: DEAD/DEAH box helicase [Myxococcota bacterium]
MADWQDLEQDFDDSDESQCEDWDDFDPDADDEAFVRDLQKAAGRRAQWRELQRIALRSAVSSRVEVRYLLVHDFEETSTGWSLNVLKRRRGRDGEFQALEALRLSGSEYAALESDVELGALVVELEERGTDAQSPYQAVLSERSARVVLPRLVAAGRCHLLTRAADESLRQAWERFCDEEGRRPRARKKRVARKVASTSTGNSEIDGEEGFEALLRLPLLRREPRDAAGDPGDAWSLEVAVVDVQGGRGAQGGEYEARGTLVRNEARLSMDGVLLVSDDGTVLFEDGRVEVCNRDDARWLRSFGELGRGARVAVPRAQLNEFVEVMFGTAGVSQLVLPSCYERVVASERPRAVLELDAPRGRVTRGRVFFEYRTRTEAGAERAERVSVQRRSSLVVVAGQRLLLRDRGAEEAALAELRSAADGAGDLDGLDRVVGVGGARCDVVLDNERLPTVLSVLLTRGWQLYAEGKRCCSLSKFDVRVEWGLDWFELQGAAAFGGTEVPLPRLLRNVARDGGIVELGDGTRGLLPVEWLARWGALATLGGKRDGKLRFSSHQVGVAQAIVDAVTAEAALGSAGAAGGEEGSGLAELRKHIEQFRAVEPVTMPAGFVGSLRPYQALGVSWLGALSDLGLGACLADDMGLGKTIQVLAHLARVHAKRGNGTARREGRQAPSLVVVPRSLLQNWRSEAARFAPELRLHSHWGAERAALAKAVGDVDVVLTTYATLRRDIRAFAKLEFSTVVLDEAQAIKNDESATAKCVKRLRAVHRIAMSGTPIENHLGELWSLVEFLNPGMLAELPGLAVALRGGLLTPGTAALIQQVLRPFVLRRTKREVASDLPERSEQTLFVELDDDERAHYDELLRFYQASIKKRGVAQTDSTPHVFEALLRLRQAACHPGLIDTTRTHERSAKVEHLLERLRHVTREGHKALVFSQFTSLLAIVQKRLREEGIAFEYLDGKTGDRAARMSRFQESDEVAVFLISLKAGGVGLNLTAADYVFILDPWWNPAAEAQAIDRAHRIGQRRNVIAYRLLARNTVEERVAELQSRKRELVAAILGDEQAFAGRLTREDLEELLDLSAA